MKKLILLFLFFQFAVNHNYAQIYVATYGNDDSLGTKEKPYATFTKAISESAPGDTICVRGGTYNLTTTITITAVKSGTDSQMCTMTAYNNEVPVLDFSEQELGSKGISLKSNYWHIIGLNITKAGDNGMDINFGSNNIIERCQFYRNNDTGLQLSAGSANNQIINCDSYYNADPPDYADADGFAPKLTVGSGNYFYGCRAWGNCDDGWDGYLRGADDVSTTLENCWTWGNGYLENGSDPGSQANGNGFKMGGGDNSNSDSLMHHFTLIKCVAFNNKAKGFDQNNNMGSMILYNCTGYNNQTANYRIQRAIDPEQVVIVKNCLSYDGLAQLGDFAIQETNSWFPAFEVTADDFLSLDTDLASAARQADGSLPDIDLLHLAEGSDLIDAGVDLGFPFNGLAPDLGAFETDFTNSINEYKYTMPGDFQLLQNYPNPFNPTTHISYILAKPEKVTLIIFNSVGQKVATLVDGEMRETGLNTAIWNGRNKNGMIVPAGVYFYRLELRNLIISTRKMLFIK